MSKKHNNWKWHKMSAAVRRENPLCAECERNGITELATEVDHIDPKGEFSKRSESLSILANLRRIGMSLLVNHG